MERKDLIYQITERDSSHSSIDYPNRTLQDWIDRAEKRGEDVYKIMTHDGFIVYEQYYITKEDGTQFLKKIHHLREDELTPKEAVTAMLKGEHLLDFGHTIDTVDYYWDGEQFIYSNNSKDYLNPHKRALDVFCELRHRKESDKITPEREAKRVFQTLGFELDLSNLPLVNRQYGLTGAMIQAINMCKAQNWDITETHIHSCLANLNSDLVGIFGESEETPIETQPEKPLVTWDDIIENLQKTVNTCKDTDGNDDPEKLAEFKKKIIGHLDNLDKKEKKSKKARKVGIKKQAKKISYVFETYSIDDYMLWDDEVFAAVQEFYKRKTIYPNILLANSKTFAKIDEHVKKYGTTSLVYKGNEDEPPEFDGLSEFTANDFSLTFCLDEGVFDDDFCLVYDNAPSFDGEKIDETDDLFANQKMKHRKYSKYKLAA